MTDEPDLLHAIDSRCDAFEAAWRRGERPAVADQLAGVPPEVRAGLEAELIRIELDWRLRAGEAPSAEEYRARHPHLADQVEGWLAAARRDRQALDAPTADPSDTRPPPADDQATLPPAAGGRRFGTFAARERLGVGGMGEVWAARDPLLHRDVAVKVMKPEVVARPGARAAFLREARAAAAVDHPNVVPIFQVGEDGGAPFIVMPLLAGRTLRDRLQAGPLPPAEVAQVAREGLAGLAAAHARGLIHRDVKPANLWLATAGAGWQLKLLDFGLTRSAETLALGLTGPGLIAGTPQYMSPEQANGRPLDPRSDLFSLGATLYEAATGAKPFDGDTTVAVLMAVATHEPPPAHSANPTVPRPLSDFIMRLLAKDPAGRPASAQAALAELDCLDTRESEAAIAPAVPRPSAKRPPGVRLRALGWAGAVAVTLGVILIAVVVGSRPGEQVAPALTQTAAAASPAVPTSPASSAAPAGYRGTVDLRVKRKNALGVEELFRLEDDLRTLPLRPGDLYQIEADVEPAGYAYLFWVAAVGEVTPLHPWPLGTALATAGPLSGETPTRHLTLPSGKGYEFEATARGLETVVLVVRPEPLGAAAGQVREWFAGRLPACRGLPANDYRIWFDDFEPRRNDPRRAPPRQAKDLGLPAYQLQAALKERLQGKAAMVWAVSFATAEK